MSDSRAWARLVELARPGSVQGLAAQYEAGREDSWRQGELCLVLREVVELHHRLMAFCSRCYNLPQGTHILGKTCSRAGRMVPVAAAAAVVAV